MAKPEKAEKPKKPLSKAKSISTIKSSKPKKKSPPAKVQLSSEFVQDSSDEDDDPPALPDETKEPTVKKQDPVVKKKGPVIEDKAPEKPKTAVVEVSSEEESSSEESEESDDSESETSKRDGNSTKVVAKSASADVSESESETEKEKEDSSDDDSDSSSGISVVAPTNKYVATVDDELHWTNVNIEGKPQPLNLARTQQQLPLLMCPKLVPLQPSNLLIVSRLQAPLHPNQQTYSHYKPRPSNKYGTSQRQQMCPSYH